jgi:hypothetical protein
MDGRHTTPGAVRDFAVGEDAPHEALTVAIDHVRDAVDFGRIETDTYNFHARPDPT